MDLKEAYKVMQAGWVKDVGLEVGDKIKLNPYFGHNCGFLKCGLSHKIIQSHGEYGIVKSIDEDNIKTKHGCAIWMNPCFALELVEKAEKPCVTVTKMVTVKDKVYSEDTVQLALEQYVKGDSQ